MIFPLSHTASAIEAQKYLDLLKEQGAIVEIKKVGKKRTLQQNKALHLFFTQVSKELNDLGIPFIYHGLKGYEIETPWTPELFKEFTWKPIQKAMFGIDSTTQLHRNQIDPIFEVINKFFAERGIEISFPNKFDYYLKFYS